MNEQHLRARGAATAQQRHFALPALHHHRRDLPDEEQDQQQHRHTEDGEQQRQRARRFAVGLQRGDGRRIERGLVEQGRDARLDRRDTVEQALHIGGAHAAAIVHLIPHGGRDRFFGRRQNLRVEGRFRGEQHFIERLRLIKPEGISRISGPPHADDLHWNLRAFAALPHQHVALAHLHAELIGQRLADQHFDISTGRTLARELPFAQLDMIFESADEAERHPQQWFAALRVTRREQAQFIGLHVTHQL